MTGCAAAAAAAPAQQEQHVPGPRSEKGSTHPSCFCKLARLSACVTEFDQTRMDSEVVPANYGLIWLGVCSLVKTTYHASLGLYCKCNTLSWRVSFLGKNTIHGLVVLCCAVPCLLLRFVDCLCRRSPASFCLHSLLAMPPHKCWEVSEAGRLGRGPLPAGEGSQC